MLAYFGCGNYFEQPNRGCGQFKCENFLDLYEKILPFFKKYKIRGVKALYFEDWCETADLMNSKDHLTYKGLARIQSLKAGMNRSRKNYLSEES